MRALIVVALALAALQAHAQQAGQVTFGMPVVDSTHDPATAVQLSRDGVIVGDVTSGQTIPNLFPANSGTWVFTLIARNTWGPGPPVQYQAVLGPPKPPGPVINVVIDAPCAKAQPPTCSLTITQLP